LPLPIQPSCRSILYDSRFAHRVRARPTGLRLPILKTLLGPPGLINRCERPVRSGTDSFTYFSDGQLADGLPCFKAFLHTYLQPAVMRPQEKCRCHADLKRKGSSQVKQQGSASQPLCTASQCRCLFFLSRPRPLPLCLSATVLALCRSGYCKESWLLLLSPAQTCSFFTFPA